MKPTIAILALAFAFTACKSSKPTVQHPEDISLSAPLFMPGPQAVVYKTTHDYYNYVPIQMNEARTEIISYPDPTDVYFRGKLAYPTRLNDGYLLDNRGIGAQTVFLDYTYEVYSKLEKAPGREELMKHLLDKHPLTEAWNCGLRSQYTDEVTELNLRIKNGFKDFKPIVKTPSLQPIR